MLPPGTLKFTKFGASWYDLVIEISPPASWGAIPLLPGNKNLRMALLCNVYMMSYDTVDAT